MKLPVLMALTLVAPAAFADPPAVRTSTVGIASEDAELAKYIDVLEEYELLEQMDMVSMLAALEDEE